jgi:hypothetical protein
MGKLSCTIPSGVIDTAVTKTGDFIVIFSEAIFKKALRASGA